MENEYKFTDGGYTVTEDMKEKFDKFGCFLVRNFISVKEIKYIKTSLESRNFREHMHWVDGGEGRKTQMYVCNQPGNDITGMLGRCEKVVETCEKLLGGEVYHYHSKLIGKPPNEGASHLWHQDYGYWYQNGCLFPDMITVFIAIDKCSKVNGCLKYLPGSQKCGRVEHRGLDGQFEADTERVKEIEKQIPLQYAELEEGDALFMHCNVLHCDSDNLGGKRRWSLLYCYNRADNNPVKEHHYPQYIPLQKVKNSEILSRQKMIESILTLG